MAFASHADIRSVQWDNESNGAPSAYFGTCVPSFPNFFILMGPNTVTGHLSVIYTVECQINFILRLIAPILQPSSFSAFPFSSGRSSSAIAVTTRAARGDSAWLQSRLGKLVWASGCTSWALHPTTGRNIMMYPDWQFKFWLRSLWVRWEDFELDEVGKRDVMGKKRMVGRRVKVAGGFAVAVAVIAAMLAEEGSLSLRTAVSGMLGRLNGIVSIFGKRPGGFLRVSGRG